MRDWVSKWVQEGDICVWRYPGNSRHAGEWHFTGDTIGCRSIRNLIGRMAGGEACHRTLKLRPVARAVSDAPGFGDAKGDHFTAMRIVFRPEASDLSIDVDGERLILTLGNGRIPALRAAFADVEVGQADFGIATSHDRKAKGWWFWWMPRS